MLNLTIGSVNSNKTDAVITTYILNEGLKPIIYYPACSNKSKNSYLARNNQPIESAKIFDITDLYNHLGTHYVLIIDEVQFICSRQYISEFMEFIEHCDKLGITVYMFGLATDYIGEPFEVISRLLPYVDKITRCNTTCECKKGKATMNIRYIDGVVDTNDNSNTLMLENSSVTYKAVCRDCFRKYTGLDVLR